MSTGKRLHFGICGCSDTPLEFDSSVVLQKIHVNFILSQSWKFAIILSPGITPWEKWVLIVACLNNF